MSPLATQRGGRACLAGWPVALGMLLAACASTPPAPVAEVNAPAGLALRGYDPVAYFTRGEPTPGVAAHTRSWGGASYRFASAEHLRLFDADPERYLPQYGGYCAIAMAWNRIADTDPQQWAIVDDRLYLNNSGFAHALWSLRKRGHIEDADRNWSAWPTRDGGP